MSVGFKTQKDMHFLKPENMHISLMYCGSCNLVDAYLRSCSWSPRIIESQDQAVFSERSRKWKQKCMRHSYLLFIFVCVYWGGDFGVCVCVCVCVCVSWCLVNKTLFPSQYGILLYFTAASLLSIYLLILVHFLLIQVHGINIFSIRLFSWVSPF